MLREKRVHKIDELAGFAKAREKEIFFQLLVILLHKVANDVGGAGQHRAVERLFGGKEIKMVLVDQQEAIEYSVLAHQIFGGGNIFGALALLRRRLLRCGEGRRWQQQSSADNR